MTKRICLWSGPRNVSTALMYSFRQRDDTSVVDEPFYAYYLARSGADHPGREESIASQSTDADEVIASVILGDYPTPIVFFKQMAHHLDGMDTEWLDMVDNVILTRDPTDMLASMTVQVPNLDLWGTSLPQQVALVDRMLEHGRDPIVLIAKEVLLDPPGVLAELCGRLGIAFDPAMLSWPPGPKPEDGPWASHFYHRVHESAGFAAHRPRTEPFPEHLEPLLAQCRPLYEHLEQFAFRP